jgi:hypothetical protein
MLVYHPAYDSYHCITRILKILTSLSKKEYPIDRIRIYDYYILFINDIKNVTLPNEYSEYKRLMKNTKYNRIENPKYVFSQLENVQNIAFRAIASFGFIDKDLFEREIIQLTSTQIPEKLIPELSESEIEYFSLVKDYFENITLKELKQRTKIMDYRYELS